jgi:hypothetical protein
MQLTLARDIQHFAMTLKSVLAPDLLGMVSTMWNVHVEPVGIEHDTGRIGHALQFATGAVDKYPQMRR